MQTQHDSANWFFVVVNENGKRSLCMAQLDEKGPLNLRLMTEEDKREWHSDGSLYILGRPIPIRENGEILMSITPFIKPKPKPQLIPIQN